LGAATSLTSSAGTITFASTTNSAANQAYGLSLTNASGAITFTGIVGGASNGSLGAISLVSAGTTTFSAAVNGSSITTDSGGSTKLNGNITTSGAQQYGDAVEIQSALTLATTNNPVLFSSTLNSQASESNDLTITAGTGHVTFTGAVGGSRGLGNIALTSTGDTTFTSTVDATSLVQNASSGTTLINGSRITTSSTQAFNNAVSLGADTALSATSVTFNHTVSADFALAITGDAVFGNGNSDTVTLSGTGKNLSVSGSTTINTDHITSRLGYCRPCGDWRCQFG
jgi:hypothetical protein